MRQHIRTTHKLLQSNQQHFKTFFTAFFSGFLFVILLRIFLTAQGSTAEGSGLASYWVDISTPLIAGFQNIYADIRTPAGVIESASLLGIVFYALIIWLGYFFSLAIVKPRKFDIAKSTIDTFVKVFEVIIALSVILEFSGASHDNGWVRLFSGISEVFIWPLRQVFSTFEFSSGFVLGVIKMMILLLLLVFDSKFKGILDIRLQTWFSKRAEQKKAATKLVQKPRETVTLKRRIN